jgi:hypothetical protein
MEGQRSHNKRVRPPGAYPSSNQARVILRRGMATPIAVTIFDWDLRCRSNVARAHGSIRLSGAIGRTVLPMLNFELSRYRYPILSKLRGDSDSEHMEITIPMISTVRLSYFNLMSMVPNFRRGSELRLSGDCWK